MSAKQTFLFTYVFFHINCLDKSIFCCIFAPLNKKITKTSVILINDTNHKSHTITLKLNSMKKIFTLIAMALMTLSVSAQMIKFEENVAAGDLNGKVFKEQGFSLTITDTGAKVFIDENSAYFGTEDSYVEFTHRLRTGGKSSSNNNMQLGIPSDGTLKLYARTGSNSATDRNVIFAQNGQEIFNKTMLETNSVTVNMDIDGTTAEKKIYQIHEISVKKGTVDVTYPTNSINFYAFEFISSGGQQEQEQVAATVSMTKDEISGYVNSEISISANVDGYPEPTIQWYKTESLTTMGEEIEGATTSTYKFTPTAEGTYYFIVKATNDLGSQTASCTVTVTDPNIYVSEDDIIFFPKDDTHAAGTLNGVTFHGGALHLTVTDTDKTKVSVENNSAYFGTEESYDKFEARMKTGGKSNTKNCLTLKSDKAGKLYIYARTGKTGEARSLVLTQDGDDIFNEDIEDANGVMVSMTTSDGTKDNLVNPVYSTEIKAGTIDITYPDNTMVIYALSLDKDITTAINAVSTVKAENSAIYNALGQRVNANAKGLMIQNGKKYIAK